MPEVYWVRLHKREIDRFFFKRNRTDSTGWKLTVFKWEFTNWNTIVNTREQTIRKAFRFLSNIFQNILKGGYNFSLFEYVENSFILRPPIRVVYLWVRLYVMLLLVLSLVLTDMTLYFKIQPISDYKSDTHKLAKSLKNLIRKGYDLATILDTLRQV